MSDPFRSHLVDELEWHLGCRLLQPDGICKEDLDAILDTIHALQDECELWEGRN